MNRIKIFESDNGPFLVEEVNEAAARNIAFTVDPDAELIDEYLTLLDADIATSVELDIF